MAQQSLIIKGMEVAYVIKRWIRLCAGAALVIKGRIGE